MSTHSIRPGDEAASAVAEEIRSYLREHPLAADTLEGIQRWWIARQRYDESLKRLQRALEQLAAEGAVEKVQVAGRVVYRLRRAPPAAGDASG